MDPDAVSDFTFVDQTDEVSFFQRFVAVANRLPGVVASKAEVIDGLRLRDGDRVLDAGCGIGDDVLALARRRQISIFDVDCDSMVVDATDHDTTRAIVRSFGDAIRHGWIGRQLPRRMRELGIDELDVRTRSILVDFELFAMMMGGHLARATAAGELDGPAVSAWYNELAQREREGTFIATLNAFIVAGTRWD